ncbi:MAG: hypothetical protein Q9219_002946 [cf. Caloplaca sp. 3 TL-2023]
MFDGYSIIGASHPHDLCFRDEDISPTSSRATTPASEEFDMAPSPLDMDTVAELSDRFRQHRLGSCSQQMIDVDNPTSLRSAVDIAPPKLPFRTSRRRSSSLLIWQQRQNMTRRQCKPAHLLQISRLVEELSQDTKPCYNATHPSSDHRSPVSPTSNPSSPFSDFESTPSSSGSEDCGLEIDCAVKGALGNKVSKEARRGGGGDALERKQKLVLKKVRMRKSLVRLRTVA